MLLMKFASSSGSVVSAMSIPASFRLLHRIQLFDGVTMLLAQKDVYVEIRLPGLAKSFL